MDRSSCLRLLGIIIPALIAFRTDVVLADDAYKAFEIGEWREISSENLDEKRSIIVGKPRSYDKSDNEYPVVILLDGDEHFHFVTAATKFLAANGYMPEVLVIGIPNTDRTRDLTPKSQNPQDKALRPTHGGANNFLSFISDELLPWLSSEYRTHDYNVIIGHSYGGLFSVHTLTTKPESFDAYIAISPSLHWNNQYLVEQAENFLQEHPRLDADLYMTAGGEGGALGGGVRKIAGLLTEYSPAGFNWTSSLHTSESHGSIINKGVYEGLKAVFSDWRMDDPVTAFEFGGVDGIVKFYERSGEKYGIDRPFTGGPLVGLTYWFIQRNRLDDAAEVLEYNNSNFQPPAILFSLLASSYRDQGDQDKALSYYSKALKINPAAPEAREGLISLGKNPEKIIEELNNVGK